MNLQNISARARLILALIAFGSVASTVAMTLMLQAPKAGSHPGSAQPSSEQPQLAPPSGGMDPSGAG